MELVMSNVVAFPQEVDWKVLFNLPPDKVIQIRKTPKDNFDVEIDGLHGSAVLKALGRASAVGRIKSIFPTCEIVEVMKL